MHVSAQIHMHRSVLLMPVHSSTKLIKPGVEGGMGEGGGVRNTGITFLYIII